MTEGTIILHDGLTLRTVVGSNPMRTLKNLADIGEKPVMGYLAYPNVSLKNDIPNTFLYEYETLEESKTLPDVKGSFFTSGTLEMSDSKHEYLKKIDKIKQLLIDGEIYQINYAIRFRKKFEGDAYAFFVKMNQVNPAEFSAFMDFGDFQIISASPERFFKVYQGKIRTEPVKGTVAKKGGKINLDRMLNSEKERAELDMITDLERNDVGKICKYGTLNLVQSRAVKELDNLWHCYSVVEGELSDKQAPFQIMNAMFPSGSVTGCPKLRAMQYIEALESIPRNIFTGSIGYVQNGKMDFNVAIRTALVRDGFIEYWAGGGIVFDSDPEKEYEEVMLKAERFLAII